MLGFSLREPFVWFVESRGKAFIGIELACSDEFLLKGGRVESSRACQLARLMVQFRP